MAREHLSRPKPLMEICPENSRYAIRWNTDARECYIGHPRSRDRLLTLDYQTGRYVYASLRGQQRIEELARPTHPPRRGSFSKDAFVASMTGSGLSFSEEEIQTLWQQLVSQRPSMSEDEKHPAITHRHLYTGADTFVHVEDAEPRTNLDKGARRANLKDDCHTAAQCFIRFNHLDPLTTDIAFAESPGYEQLAATLKKNDFPQLVEIAMRDPKVRNNALLETHSCIVLGFADNEFICFEKVGNALPWRLSTLREIHDMYERDFKNANNGRPRLFWTVSTLPHEHSRDAQ